MSGPDLSRLLRPRSIAFIGGQAAGEAVRQSAAFGFSGPIWQINPRRRTMAGIACLPDISALPAAPDAVFLAAPARPTIVLAGELAAAGAGGAICYAAGFAEEGDSGRARQADLLAASGVMPLIGPNCSGMLNAFDGAAMWPDQHGCLTLTNGRGVAIISQSGNLALNLTMQARGLPIGYVISVGNCANVTPADLIEALVTDPRVSAIGLHLEALGSLARFSQACLAARPAPGATRLVVSALPENLPKAIAARLMGNGIVAVAGLTETLKAIAAAARIGDAWALPPPPALPEPAVPAAGTPTTWDEVTCKAALHAFAVPVPAGRALSLAQIEMLFRDRAAPLPIAFPLVLKAVGRNLAHKTECGGVALGIASHDQLLAAAQQIAP